jgi:hypothetical protein
VSRDDTIPVEWEMVDRTVPVDLSNIGDKGMKGAVMLAVALGWNLHQRRGAPAQLKSRQGLTRNIPTDTGVRQSVFWSIIASILSHSDGKLPSPHLIEQIVKQTGMSKTHAQVLTSRTAIIMGGGKVEEEEPEPEPEPEPDPMALPTPEQIKEIFGEPTPVATTPVVAEFVPTERTEPTLNHQGDGKQYISEIMVTVIRQLEADGDEQITYRCAVCGLEYETKRGVGAHYQRHVQAGEAESTSGKPRTTVNVIPNYQPTEVHVNRGGATAEVRRLQRILADVRKAVGQDEIKNAERQVMVAQRKITEVEKENERLVERNRSLEQSLNTLHDLLGEIREPTTKGDK